MKNALKQRGFTLIEVLVVISIIGILVAVLYASFGEARNEARNKAIQAELKEVQLGLELYKAQNGVYPPAPAAPCSVAAGTIARRALSTTVACAGIYIDGLIPDYIAGLPSHKDSGNSNCRFNYMVANDGSWYKLTAVRCHAGAADASEGVQAGDEFARCLTSCGLSCTSIVTTNVFYESYAVYSAGGECRL